MVFGISQETSFDSDKSRLVQELSDFLNKHLSNVSFGKSVESLSIGIICVKPEFDFFFKERKPQLIKGKRSFTFHGLPMEVSNDLSYGIKLDYEKMNTLEPHAFINALSQRILESIDGIRVVQDIGDFNIDAFQYFLKQGIDDFIKKNC